jgi:SAM-dependent methyltransferase
MDVPVTSEAVRWGYRLFLDREAENQTVVEEKARHCRSTQDLRYSLMNSEEFKSKNTVFPTLSGHEPPLTIDAPVSDSELRSVFAHIRESWSSLGKDDPYYSVLTRGKFWRPRMSAKRIEEFYESGKDEVDRLFKTLERNGIDHISFQKCLDFGCGAGRISRWLSDEFEAVFAYDVSEDYLEIARKYFEKKSISNVTFQQVTDVGDFESFPKVDLIYSVIVLQHNPPPVIHRAISHFMRALNSGGVAFFQVPTYKEGYRFVVDEYLSNPPPRGEIEMHVLPQKTIFEILKKENGNLLEIVEDFCAKWGLSNTFLVQKH